MSVRDDTTAPAEPTRVLCAHADNNGEGAHWLQSGEVCHED